MQQILGSQEDRLKRESLSYPKLQEPGFHEAAL